MVGFLMSNLTDVMFVLGTKQALCYALSLLYNTYLLLGQMMWNAVSPSWPSTPSSWSYDSLITYCTAANVTQILRSLKIVGLLSYSLFIHVIMVVCCIILIWPSTLYNWSYVSSIFFCAVYCAAANVTQS